IAAVPDRPFRVEAAVVPGDRPPPRPVVALVGPPRRPVPPSTVVAVPLPRPGAPAVPCVLVGARSPLLGPPAEAGAGSVAPLLGPPVVPPAPEARRLVVRPRAGGLRVPGVVSRGSEPPGRVASLPRPLLHRAHRPPGRRPLGRVAARIVRAGERPASLGEPPAPVRPGTVALVVRTWRPAGPRRGSRPRRSVPDAAPRVRDREPDLVLRARVAPAAAPGPPVGVGIVAGRPAPPVAGPGARAREPALVRRARVAPAAAPGPPGGVGLVAGRPAALVPGRRPLALPLGGGAAAGTGLVVRVGAPLVP